MELQVVKDELFKTLDDFANELDIAFEYIDNVQSIKEFISQMKSNEQKLDAFLKSVNSDLCPYEVTIGQVATTNGKLRTRDFDFFEELVLFSGLLPFNKFKSENKNTKKVLVTYLYNMYMASVVMQFGDSEFLQNYISRLTAKQSDQISPSSEPSAPSGTKRTRRMNNLNGFGLGGLEEVMGSLLGNSNIMEIASDLSKEIENEKIDPTAMLSSLLSGSSCDKTQKIIKNLTGKIEQKLNSGEIDKNALEKASSSLLQQLNSKLN